MFEKLSIKDAKIKDQTALVRVDYNVPLETEDDTVKVASDLRICASLPTINYLLDHGAQKVILISHLGRPEGRDKSLSLKPVAAALAGLLPGRTVNFVDDVSGPEVEAAAEALPEGGILLLENLRFNPAEEQNSEEYAEEIVSSVHPDFFVQDGFAVVHRAHASTAAITKLLPSYAGLLLEKEIDTLSKVCHNPKRPLTVIIGGAKVEDKLPLVKAFENADHILVGGKIAVDLVDGKIEIGDSEDFEAEALLQATKLARKDGPSEEWSSELQSKFYIANDFDDKMDIGPVSTAKFVEIVQNSKTVIWNGCLGKTEDPAFATSSTILAKTLGEAPNITSVICGGDTTGFVESLQAEDPNLQYTLVSTGGGAALEFLTGQPLPGVEALEDKN